MADDVTAKNESKFRPHPPGQYPALCVDTIAMGEKVEQFPGHPERLVQKCVLVFRTGEVNPETGEMIDIAREFTVSMGEKANLRRFLEDWRGKSYTEDEADEGVPIKKMVGVPALITVEHRKSGKGRTYANIKGITMLPKAMAAAAPSAVGYERAAFYAERKAEYAKEAGAYRDSISPQSGRRVRAEDSGGIGLPDPEEIEDDSELPF